MGILDEAIREHLDLKRQHGADDSELKQLEDQAFGPPERPGAEAAPAAGEAAAEAATEFMSQPDTGEETAPPPIRREPAAGMADIQEAPARPEESEDEPAAAEEEERAEQPAAEEDRTEQPAAEEESAAEHEAIPSAPVEHSTEERHAIADQPTQMYDVEEEFAATDAPAPPDEDLVAEEMTEARLAPADPVTPAPEPAAEDEDDDFFDEQRLSEELDQALEAPVELKPEGEAEREPEPASEEPQEVAAQADEDVLEETPDFLEEAPEDDQLWFEQKPPKDFDFDD